jgi:hypothetical protein
LFVSVLAADLRPQLRIAKHDEPPVLDVEASWCLNDRLQQSVFFLFGESVLRVEVLHRSSFVDGFDYFHHVDSLVWFGTSVDAELGDLRFLRAQRLQYEDRFHPRIVVGVYVFCTDNACAIGDKCNHTSPSKNPAT